MPKKDYQKICLACGVDFLGRKNAKFCSRYCFENSPQLVAFSRGERHYNYKHDKVSAPGILEAIYEGDEIDFTLSYHYWRTEEHGDYVHFHARLTRERGKAVLLNCDGCVTASAVEWAWLHGTDFRDFSNYVALCYSCHRSYDSLKTTERL